jgi:predicted SnoaL-like aldol condensation-catalyzing enzyme
VSGLGAALADMAKHGVTMKYDKVHRVLGEGEFVLAISEGSFAGKPTAFYDLFRVEEGKIAEHWDVIEPIAPRDQWKNANGKF